MYEYAVTLDRVVDGDTVDFNIDLGFHVVLKKQRVRLLAIDTPEKRTRNLVEKHFGIIAATFVTTKLAEATIIVLHTSIDGGKDKYGRLLGEIYVDDDLTSLNAQMIELRYAVHYLGQNKSEVAQSHLDNQAFLTEHELVDVPADILELMQANKMVQK